jgi:hypothetical protein
LIQNEARDILKLTFGKTKLIKEISEMDIKVGIAARQIENSEQLEKEGFLVWELGDLL